MELEDLINDLQIYINNYPNSIQPHIIYPDLLKMLKQLKEYRDKNN